MYFALFTVHTGIIIPLYLYYRLFYFTMELTLTVIIITFIPVYIHRNKINF